MIFITVSFNKAFESVYLQYGSSSYTFTVSGTKASFEPTTESTRNVTLICKVKLGYSISSAVSTIGSGTISDNVVTIAINNTDGSDNTITLTSKPQTIDLTTLSGWSSLADGDYSITIKTNATGYTASTSNAVAVTKAQVIPDKIIKTGTYIFSSTLPTRATTLSQEITFISGGNTYSKMEWKPTGLITGLFYDSINVYSASGNTWGNEDYQIVKFENDVTVSPEFYNWFTANASEYMPTIVAGTYVFKETPTIPDNIRPKISDQTKIKTYYLTANNTYATEPTALGSLSLFVQFSNLGILYGQSSFLYNAYQQINNVYTWYTSTSASTTYTATDTTKLRTWIIESDITVSAEFYEWAIVNGNLVKQEEPYTITANLTNCVGASDNPQTIEENTSATLIFTAESGYELPNTITVAGCTYTWEQSTGTLNISNPTDNVLISISAIRVYNITTSLTGCTGASSNPTTIKQNGTATLTFTANDNYTLPDSVTVSGATSTWDKLTGKLALSNPTGNVSITIVAISTTPKLATPQNVAIDGTVLSWDAVENATSYDIYADGTLIGNTPGGGSTTEYKLILSSEAGNIDSIKVNNVEKLSSLPYTLQNGDTIVIHNAGSSGAPPSANSITINGTNYENTTISLNDTNIEISGGVNGNIENTVTINFSIGSTVVMDPDVVRVSSGNLTSSQTLVATNDENLLTNAIVKNIFTNYANETWSEILTTFGIDTNEPVTTEQGTTITDISSYALLSASASIFAIKEGSTYTLNTNGNITAVISSSELIGATQTPLFVIVDGNNGVVKYSDVLNLDTTTGQGTVELPGLGMVFLIGKSSETVKTLEDSTWEEIAAAATDGTASTKWAVGDEKNITLTTGEEITVQILGFNHDDLVAGGKAGITFGMKNLLGKDNVAETSKMMSSAGSNNYWSSSVMRQTTLSNILTRLPDDLKDVIISCKKKTMLGKNNTSIGTNIEVLFLFAPVELNGTTSAPLSNEGTQYEYYKTHGYTKSYGSVTQYWLRSPYAANGFYDVTATGISHYSGTASYGICFGFCVGVGIVEVKTTVQFYTTFASKDGTIYIKADSDTVSSTNYDLTKTGNNASVGSLPETFSKLACVTDNAGTGMLIVPEANAIIDENGHTQTFEDDRISIGTTVSVLNIAEIVQKITDERSADGFPVFKIFELKLQVYVQWLD